MMKGTCYLCYGHLKLCYPAQQNSPQKGQCFTITLSGIFMY